MKYRLPLVSLFSAFLVAGCGKSDTAPTAAAAPAASAPAPQAAAVAAAPQVIEVTAGDTMKFASGGQESGPGGGLKLEAKAGSEIKIILTNTGTMPKEAMGHNLVLLKPGSDPMAFGMAAMAAKATDYIPDALKDQVVAHTALLGPRKSDEIVLKDLAPGEYPFLCSFTAHAQIGMKGVLIVK